MFERRQRKRGQRLAFSEVKIGDAYDSEAYEVEADEVKQTSAMWDPWEYHLDDASAEASLFEGATASGIHTLAIANLLGHYTGPDHDIVAWWVRSTVSLRRPGSVTCSSSPDRSSKHGRLAPGRGTAS